MYISIPHMDDALYELAFDHSAQPGIISVTESGKILKANNAVCELLGYSKTELLEKNFSTIFEARGNYYSNLIDERARMGHVKANVAVLQKSGCVILCEVTSSAFIGNHGINKSITSIVELSRHSAYESSPANESDPENRIKESSELSLEVPAEVSGIHWVQQQSLTAISPLATNEVSDKPGTNANWVKHIAQASYDVMWDWDRVTGNVYVGDSMEELFGYHIPGNNIGFAELNRMVFVNDGRVVLRRLLATLHSGANTWTDSFTIRRQDGSMAFVESRGSVLRDQDGNAIRIIGATQDVSRLRELESNLRAHQGDQLSTDDIPGLSARLSYDGIWDWNIASNEFFLSEGFEKLFGHSLTVGNKLFNWGDFLHKDDRARVEQGIADILASDATTWVDAYRFLKNDGTVVNVYGRASIIRNKDGKAIRMLGAIHDLTRQKELESNTATEKKQTERRLSEHEENFRIMFNSSSDILYDIDLGTDEVIMSNGYEKEFGYPIVPHMKTGDVWGEHVHPEDKSAVMDDYTRMMESHQAHWHNDYRFLRADGSVANILSSRILLRHQDGTAYRIIGSMHDISKQTLLEEKLAQEIQLKEFQIANAMEDARESARADIGKELHDNVNQLLGVSRLYLQMAKQGGPDSAAHLGRSSEYTLSAIEEIRKLSKALSTENIKVFGLSQSIKDLASVSMEIGSLKISCMVDPKLDDLADEKYKLNLFRIIQEQLNNILKHAAAKNAAIRLSKTKKAVVLDITDDGVGFDTTKKHDGIGVQNIKSRVATFHGQVAFESSVGKGCRLHVEFEIPSSQPDKAGKS